MKILSVVGARPQFVKLAPIARALDGSHEHIVVHTGQHYDDSMSEVFFRDLGIAAPDVNLAVGSGAHGAQTATMLAGLEPLFEQHRPDWVLVYGDTNSTLAAAVAAVKLHLPLAHLEAGLRSFNRRMPEEHNRVLTDHAADLCLAPTAVAMRHLTAEGLADRSVLVGDVMTDVLYRVREAVRSTPPALPWDGPTGVVATIHRAENTDDPERLEQILHALASLDRPVRLLAHPRLVAVAAREGISLERGAISVVPPLPYPELIAAVLSSRGVVTDSGGLQKEAFLLGRMCTTVRSETEWVETVESGWNVIVGDRLDELATFVARPTAPEPADIPYGDGRAAEAVVATLRARLMRPPRHMSPHLLYTAWGFPPSRGAGMYRALATVTAFIDAGWRVTVLTADRAAFETLTGIDTDAEARVHPAATVVRVRFDARRGERDLGRWSRLRMASPLLWSGMRLLVETARFPEPGYGHWAAPLAAAARAIHQRDPVDLTIGTANPNVDFVPGEVLHRRAGVPYVLDYRDTWHLDMYADRRRGSQRSRSARRERRLQRNASEIWFVNAPIRDWHAHEFRDAAERMHVVQNGFDPDFLEPRSASPAAAARPLTLGYLGTIYGPMPLRETLDGWRLARIRSPLVAEARFVIRGRLGHYSTPDAATAALISSYRDDNVIYEGPASKADVAGVYTGFDALALILGRSRYVTSGKVFEYAATGLPIVAAHHPETASTSVLTGYPSWYPIVQVEPDDIATAIVRALESATASDAADRQAAARRWAEHLERDRQLAPRIRALRSLVDGRRA